MDENWYTNESVWSLSFFYPDPQEDLKEKKKKIYVLASDWRVLWIGVRSK